MRILRTIKETAVSFGKDRGGNFAIVFGIAAWAIVMSAGYGVNVTQLYHVRSDLSNALDAAVTSTARDLTTGVISEEDARETVEAFLAANSGSGFASADEIKLDRLVVDRIAETVEASASAEVALAFPLFGSSKTRRVAAESAALYSDNQIEIAMMLDVTGSMRGSKIRDLKEAAELAVETLLGGQDEDNPRIRVSMIPFANSVNAGAYAAESVFVERKETDRGEAPGNEEPQAVSHGKRDNCATERKGKYQFSDDGPDVSMVNRDFFLSKFAEESENPTPNCPRTALVPLTASKDRLLDAIDDLRVGGGTAGHIGIQWSWYALSPRWGRVFDGDARPAAYDDEEVVKYAILMTDGEFNLSYFDADEVSEFYNDRGKAAPRNAAKRLCQEMRDSGIEVFTIGFKLEERNAKETMSACAGEPRNYFETNNAEELKGAYLEIIQRIERLTLTR